MDKGIVEATSYVDAIEYTNKLDIPIDFIFVDASHEKDFCYPMAKLFTKQIPKCV